jgi:hypothetical protein
MRDWARELEQAILDAAAGDRQLEAFVRANVDSVKQLLRGAGPDDIVASDGAGACIVFNMSCKHVPALCQDSTGKQDAYKNTYDLKKAGSRRQRVDEAVEAVCHARGVALKKETIYFAAVETTGTGIRFFGDLCLVLRFRPHWEKPGHVPAAGLEQQTLVLERNSYDLVRAPLVSQIDTAPVPDEERERVAAEWAGSWSGQLTDMVALRVLQDLPKEQRRWTSGEISRVILDDEDYSEVLFPRSFDVTDLVEVRTTAAEAAAEGDIADRERTGEAPGLHELEWRQQRRDARKALAAARIPLRVVTSSGRVRGS